MIPGKTNRVWCGINADQTAKYSITLQEYRGTHSTKSDIKEWIIDDHWEGTIPPGDDIPKKAIRIDLPDNAPEETLVFKVVIKKDGNLISEQDLDFEVSRQGIFRATMC
jgi:hypothetical protein